MKRAVTLTVVANMTSNYSEGLGNISSVQKIFKEQHVYAVRSRESLKNAICVQAGLYDDLESEIYTPEHQAEYQKTLLRVIHENIDSFGF